VVSPFQSCAKKDRVSGTGSREATEVIGMVPVTTLLPVEAIEGAPPLPLPPLPHEIRERSATLQTPTRTIWELDRQSELIVNESFI
jgi:hypothetical protein